MPRPVRFALVDVFGRGPLTGNPLAVLDLTTFPSGDPADAWMAAVAHEMNQAETTFVLPPTGTADARLRSFTAGGVEVYGAGHNALGAWWWLLGTGAHHLALIEVTTSVDAQGLYVAAIGSGRPVHTAHTRFFNPGVRLDEDPATGSAAGPLAAYLDHLGLLDERRSLRVEQGCRMGRPSTLTAHITADGHAAVGGPAVVTAQGWIRGPEQ